MSLDDLRLVLAVAQHGSFIAAARRTGTPVSSVSRAVARFEDAIGVKLFQRTSRQVVLTQEGGRLLERAQLHMDQLSSIVDDVRSNVDVTGRLRVTAPTATGATRIAAALASFALAHPGVEIELSLTNEVVDLVERGIDLAFRGGPVRATELVAQRLWKSEFALGAAASFVRNLHLRRSGLDRETLCGLPAVLTAPNQTWRFRRADGHSTDVTPHGRFVVDDLRVAIDLARRGLGIVHAPAELLRAAQLDVLTLDPDLGEAEGRELFAVYPSRRLVPKRVKLAIEWVRSCDAQGQPQPRE